MGRTGEHTLNHVVLARSHTGNSAAAAVLNVVFIGRQTLDITVFGLGNDTFFLGNQVFNVHFARNVRKFGTALVGKTVAQIERFGLNNVQNARLGSQNSLAFLNEVLFFL